MGGAKLRDQVAECLGDNRYDTAAKLIYLAAQEAMVEAQTLRLGAEAAYQSDLYDIAIDLYERLLAREPIDAGQLAKFGHALEVSGQDSRALYIYERSVSLDPNSIVVRYNLGTLYYRRSDWGKSIDHLTAACELAPDLELAQQNLVRALIGAEYYGACYPRLERCLRTFDDGEPYAILQAETFLSDSNPKKAKRIYTALLAKSDGRFDCKLGILQALTYTKKFNEVRSMIAELREQDYGGDELDNVEASVLLEQGYAQEAFNLLKPVVERDPMSRQPFLNLIDACIQTGRPELGMEYCEDRLERISGNPEALAYLGICYLAARRLDAFKILLPASYIVQSELACPEGFDNLADFNQAVCTHIQAHPTMARSPVKHSTVGGNQTGSLLLSPMGPIAVLIEVLKQMKSEYRAHFRSDDNPMFRRWSDNFGISIWAVELKSGGHQEPHIHPSAFLSGVYYPKLPNRVRENEDQEGHIQFFKPPLQFSMDASPVLIDFAPMEGRLFMFPSGYFHHTVPFNQDQTRISVAFDFFALD
jgi:tetratricopeptide (TPR) repeat protein